MRKDILEFVKKMKKEGIRPNYSLIARQYNCDYRTVKRYYEDDKKEEKGKKMLPSN
jgi:DNA invertase Pin-like site-specific DNA recombinase